jgi:NAD-specific glutamate dehydrogenase
MNWLEFSKLREIQRLTLHEQKKQYNLYINEWTYQRNAYLAWLEGHKKGPLPPKLQNIENIGVLLQEDLFDLEQEDGSKIYITGYA